MRRGGRSHRVDREGGVLRGGAEEDQLSRLHVGEKHVLLLLVEAVDLVHEEDRRHVAQSVLILRLLCDRADVLHPRSAAGERAEWAARVLGYHRRNARLPTPRRTEENRRGGRVVLQQSSDHSA